MTKITPRAANRISRAVTNIERLNNSSKGLGGFNPSTNYSSVIVKTPSGGIPARSGTTLGSASCTIQVVDKSNDSISDGSSIDVLNLSTTAVAGTTYINAIRDRAGNFVADLNNAVIPATKLELNASDTGIFKGYLTTTKTMAQISLVGTPSLWSDYWASVPSGSTAGNISMKLAGAYVVNIPFFMYLNGSKGTQVELDVVGGTNVFAYTTDTPAEVDVELWATDAANTTYPGTSGDGVLLDNWKNKEQENGLAVGNAPNAERSGILSAMFESEVDDFELQVWHWDANVTASATIAFMQREGGWLFKLPNSIDSTFDGTDLGAVSP